VFLVVFGADDAGRAQSMSVFESFVAEYRSGNFDPFTKTFPDYAAFTRARRALVDEMGKTNVWEPSRTSTALELALWAAERWPDGAKLVDTARRMVLRRPSRPGTDAAMDRYEIAFHHFALASLINPHRDGQLQIARQYLLDTDARFSSNFLSRGLLNDPRWQLTKGWFAEAQSVPMVSDYNASEPLPSLTVYSPFATTALNAASAAYERAREYDEAAPEATVRLAFTLHRLQKNRFAAGALRRVTPATVINDPLLYYWRALIAGRIHEALDERDDAEREYRLAASGWKTAQTPLLALASLLERQGRSPEAEAWASRVRALPPDATDPWWDYFSADQRFIGQWRTIVRQARP
jgi:tetratricopeptide (TPR) repeat protein